MPRAKEIFSHAIMGRRVVVYSALLYRVATLKLIMLSKLCLKNLLLLDEHSSDI